MQRVHLHNSNSLLQEEREKGREGEREREKSGTMAVCVRLPGIRLATIYATSTTKKKTTTTTTTTMMLSPSPSSPFSSFDAHSLEQRIPSYENRESKDYYV